VQVFGFLMGQVMKKLGKSGNHGRAKQVLEEAIKVWGLKKTSTHTIIKV
jgi:Asp-tRNA(Asn)/Glu-tRNA(Gln) amidotransferase B subunit